ncbi:very short patch repair endonuclease [Micromonospora andamanensis]|uniref:very short patch repair endonuclease n=1 Tax=Micromonospora andamanensis TaxID=1287068 RepID=UPI00194F6BAB|nr:very short patch repair endonuclease [Micromonospora andamanensis]GIJ37542.1 very short patch repair endonuclease [Micromonospora andamanensis]
MRDPEVTSRIMAAVRNRNTKPELALRSALWRRRLRFRVRTALTGKPDIVFVGPQVAVFVDGDFWHGNAWRVRGLPSFDAQFERMNNPEFWKSKLEANMARDATVNSKLADDGWSVYRVFESRLAKDLDGVADEIEQLVRSRRVAKVSTVEAIDTPQEYETEKPCRGQ